MSADETHVGKRSIVERQSIARSLSNDGGGNWRVVAASVCGVSHRERDLPCQDAHAWRVLPDDILVAAVADGAGSAILGEIGAALAVQTAIAAIEASSITQPPFEDDESWYWLLIEAVESAKKTIQSEAIARQVKPCDLATTLILAIATPELVAAIQIGDGACVVSDQSDDIFTLTVPQSGEYINETTFLTSQNTLSAACTTLWRGSTMSIAILSDGLQMLALKMPDAIPHVPFFSPLFHFAGKTTDETAAQDQLTSFLASPRLQERTDDDLTLLLAALVR